MQNMQKGFSKIILVLIILAIAIGGFFVYKQWLVKEKAPKTWVEEFEEPIDPITQPKEHRAVYEKIQKMVHFPVKYPEKLPEGYKLVRVESGGAFLEDVGGFIAEYNNPKGHFKLTEGSGDLGGLIGGKQIVLENKEIAYFWRYKGREGMINLLWFGGTSDFPYRLSSTDFSEDDLVGIANLIIQHGAK